MTFFCFIESDISSVPHMEPLSATSFEDAAREAEYLLSQHVSGYAAHIVQGEKKLLTLRASRQRRAPAESPSWQRPEPRN